MRKKHNTVRVFGFHLLHRYFPGFPYTEKTLTSLVESLLSDDFIKNSLNRKSGGEEHDAIHGRQAANRRATAQFGLNVIFINSKGIQDLNSQFRSKATPTDVLSFAPGEESNLAEIYISPDYVKKSLKGQEAEYMHIEIIRLIIHGMLHIIGMEHDGYFNEADFLPKVVAEELAGADGGVEERKGTRAKVNSQSRGQKTSTPERIFQEQERLLKKLLTL